MHTNTVVPLVFVASLVLALPSAAADSKVHTATTRDTNDSLVGHHNHIAAFVGATFVEEAADLTFGLEHEYTSIVFGHQVGIGPSLEYVRAEHSEIIAVGLVYVHPWHALKLFAGPGYDRVDGHREWLLRSGASYELHIGSFSLAPTIAMDRFAHHTAVVGGIAAGIEI